MDTRLWHPFANMHAVRGAEIVIDRAEGVHVWDVDGNVYLDGTASLWCVNVGHGRTEIADAVRAQMDRLATYQCFGAFANQPALDLAERLAGLAPVDDARVFLGSGGGDAIDTAAKLARRYFAATGQPERVHLISRTQGYHGTHGVGTSIGGTSARWTRTRRSCPTTRSRPSRTRSPASAPSASRRCSSSPSSGRAASTSPCRATSRASPRCARAPACCSSSTP
jgi:adenosylmethionine-8-amino-7-oxononanoate aminotransferase